MNKSLLTAMLCLLQPSAAQAGEADVIDARVSCDGSCSFHVTVKHADEGWLHYTDKWDILTTDAKVIATRTLYHPHEHEQPFTRSLSNVEIPQNIHTVVIRAHDSVHAYGGKTFTLQLPDR